MKYYLDFEGLSYFLNNLYNKFSILGHKHTKSEITDLEDLSSIATYNERLSNLEKEVESLNSIINNNNILVVNDSSN